MWSETLVCTCCLHLCVTEWAIRLSWYCYSLNNHLCSTSWSLTIYFEEEECMIGTKQNLPFKKYSYVRFDHCIHQSHCCDKTGLMASVPQFYHPLLQFMPPWWHPSHLLPFPECRLSRGMQYLTSWVRLGLSMVFWRSIQSAPSSVVPRFRSSCLLGLRVSGICWCGEVCGPRVEESKRTQRNPKRTF